MSAQLFAKKFHSIGACPEGREWILKGNHFDFARTWKICPAAEFMSWVAVRLLGVDGARASLACAKAAAKLYDDKLLAPGIALCDGVLDKRTRDLAGDLTRMQEHAYDATAAALDKRPSGEALLALSYTEYAIVLAVQASQTKDADARKAMIMKAAQHASDACIHAWEAMPGKNTTLAQLVRENVKEDALLRAWQAIPNPR